MARTVHIYSAGWLPRTTGDGTSAGMYSDVRAYLDLGWQVEFVYFGADQHREPPRDAALDPGLDGVQWTYVPSRVDDAVDTAAWQRGVTRLAYWAGAPPTAWLTYRFRGCAQVCEEVRRRDAHAPGDVHQFEYLATGAAAAYLPGLNTVFRVHDIESHFVEKHHAIRREVDAGHEPPASERRGLRRLVMAERTIAERSRLVLCYARHESEFIRTQWHCSQAEHLPISWPDEMVVTRTRGWLADGKLRLLHVGRIDSLPSFRSLQFLFTEVLPRLDPAALDRLELLVVGEVRDTSRARTILEMAGKYPNVTVLGHQADLRPLYGQVDLHVIGSTEATGLRTRIIESLAFGVPVLSTAIGAAGLETGDAVAIAADPPAFVRHIQAVLDDPRLVEQMSLRGRCLYDSQYSRQAIAARLGTLLTRYVA